MFQIYTEELEQAVFSEGPEILNGKAVAKMMLLQLQGLSTALQGLGITPKLAVVQIGNDIASNVYIRHKVRACAQIGIESEHIHKPTIDGEALRNLLESLNRDASVHGILLQLPLPGEIDGAEALLAITPEKDVDGFHPVNLGGLMAGRALLEPCTPRGVMTLLRAARVDLRGKRATVIGRSVIVGRPMSLMLARANATVTLCHRHTLGLEKEVARADVLVVATGMPGLVRGEWIKEGAVVIDVGISRVNSSLVGDVDFDGARKRGALITPVPGGVGPMTVATLMENTLRATCIQNDLVLKNGHLLTAKEAGCVYDRLENLGYTRLSVLPHSTGG